LIEETLQDLQAQVAQGDDNAKWVLQGYDSGFANRCQLQFVSEMNALYRPQGYYIALKQEMVNADEHSLALHIIPNKDTSVLEKLLIGEWSPFGFKVGSLKRVRTPNGNLLIQLVPAPDMQEVMNRPANGLLPWFCKAHLLQHEKRLANTLTAGEYFDQMPEEQQKRFGECVTGIFYPPHSYNRGSSITQLTDPSYRAEMRKAVAWLMKEAKPTESLKK
jgi:hypothetical protein